MNLNSNKWEGQFQFRINKKNGETEEAKVNNNLADEGEQDFLNTCLCGGTDGDRTLGKSSKNYFRMRLFNDTPVDTDSISDITGELAEEDGYEPIEIIRDNANWFVGRSYTMAQGSNKDLFFFDKNGHDDVTVALVDTGSLTISVSTHDVTINIDAGVTTATEIRNAVLSDDDAKALLICELADGQDGTGTPAAFAETDLDGVPYAISAYQRFTASADWDPVDYVTLSLVLPGSFDPSERLIAYAAVPGGPNLSLLDGESLDIRYRIKVPFLGWEGAKALLETYFQGGVDGDTVSYNSSFGEFHVRLFNDTPTNTDTLSTLTGEPDATGNDTGYEPMVIQRNDTDSGWTLTFPAGNYVATSAVVRFINTGDPDESDWDSVTYSVLTLDIGDYEFVLDYDALAGATVLEPGESLLVDYAETLG